MVEEENDSVNSNPDSIILGDMGHDQIRLKLVESIGKRWKIPVDRISSNSFNERELGSRSRRLLSELELDLKRRILHSRMGVWCRSKSSLGPARVSIRFFRNVLELLAGFLVALGHFEILHASQTCSLWLQAPAAPTPPWRYHGLVHAHLSLGEDAACLEKSHLLGVGIPDVSVHLKLVHSEMLASEFFEWSRGNLTGIMHTLRCFSLLSGLSINLKKSQLLGVGIPESQVLEAATLIGCSVLHTPFKYLGIMVGENMSSIRAWDETVNKLKMSLSSWKLKTLSIGGRLTLLKSVLGSTPIYNMSLFKVPKAVLKSMESIRRNFFNGIRDGEKKIAWVSWSKVLASKSNGGLGVSSFYALNRGLLFKWIWRFLSRDQSLWAQVIHALHGSNTSTLSASYSSLWSSIIKECNALKSQGLDLISHCKIRVGNGMSTSFWHDQWLGDSCLRLSYPRLFALENNKVCSVAAKMSAPFVSSLRRDVRGGEESAQLSRISDLLDTVVLSNMGDRRFWDLNGDGCFRVKDVRRLLDDMLLPKSDVPSRWVKQIPIKVNVLAWKISMDRLPTRVNLHRRGVQVSPISCPICCEALENLDHLLFCCDLAKDIARFNQVQNKCWKECFTLPGGVSGHIETISSSLIQIFEKMIFLKT
ncbi:RNA-directed DNA polymerase, eukaryota, reverse transcriptase zinc-binding domain protein [Tanacetum coccineum]